MKPEDIAHHDHTVKKAIQIKKIMMEDESSDRQAVNKNRMFGKTANLALIPQLQAKTIKECEIEGFSEEVLLRSFRKKYEERVFRERCSFFRTEPVQFNYKKASLEVILQYALAEGDAFTFGVLVKLGWLDAKGKLGLSIPALKKAIKLVRPVVSSENGPSL